MVHADLPIVERVERLHAQGFAVEIWDWTRKDLPALAATGARFTSMTGYVEGDLIDPDGADTLLRTAEQSIEASRALGSPNLNLHGTGLDGQGLPVKPVEVVTGEMWLAAAGDAGAGSPSSASATTSCSPWRTSTSRSTTPARRSPGPRTRWRWSRPSGSPHLRMNLDLYHAQIGEGNLIELVRDVTALGRRDPGRRRTRAVRARHRGDQLPGDREGARGRGLRGQSSVSRRGPSGDSDAAVESFRSAFTV